MRHDNRWRNRMRLLAVFFALPTLGCGVKAKPEFGNDVSGTVFYQGKPLAEGTVTFIPVAGHKVGGAQIQEDGSYHVSDVPPGEMKITVKTGPLGSVPERGLKKAQESLKTAGREFTKEEIDKMPPHMKRAALENIAPGKYVRVPPQYGDPDRSGLRYTVIEGKQEHDIQLK